MPSCSSAGKLIGEPEVVRGQLNIHDTAPGMPRYGPTWQNYVIVPRAYEPISCVRNKTV